MNLPDVDWQSKDWTIPGQIKKILEETGEVAEAIGNRDYVEIIKESLDTMQTCKTLISMVMKRDVTGIDLDELLREHTEKLIRKGYLKKPGSSLDSIF